MLRLSIEIDSIAEWTRGEKSRDGALPFAYRVGCPNDVYAQTQLSCSGFFAVHALLRVSRTRLQAARANTVMD
jgi:hypothetical protein